MEEEYEIIEEISKILNIPRVEYIHNGLRNISNGDDIHVEYENGRVIDLRIFDINKTKDSCFEHIVKLKHLQRLSYNSRTDIYQVYPSKFDNIEKLESLKSLQLLNLSGKNIVTFPKNLCMKSLKKLLVTNTSITTFPEEINTLENLEEFNISSNELLEEYPPMCNLKNLYDLDIGSCMCEKRREKEIYIPPEIFDLDLKILWLASLSLTEIPPEIKKLKNLEELQLSYNKIQTIPEWIFEMPHLKKLYLSFNQISVIPYYMKGMSNFKSLSLIGNPLKSIESIYPLLCNGNLSEMKFFSFNSTDLMKKINSEQHVYGDRNGLQYIRDRLEDWNPYDLLTKIKNNEDLTLFDLYPPKLMEYKELIEEKIKEIEDNEKKLLIQEKYNRIGNVETQNNLNILL